MHILGAIAEFERERIRERVLAGLTTCEVARTQRGRPNRELPPQVCNWFLGLGRWEPGCGRLAGMLESSLAP